MYYTLYLFNKVFRQLPSFYVKSPPKNVKMKIDLRAKVVTYIVLRAKMYQKNLW